MGKINEKIRESITRRRGEHQCCSRATLGAVNEVCVPADKQLSEETVEMLSTGFRGGIGKTFDEGTCGALTGGVIALGLTSGNDPTLAEARAKKLYLAFKDENGTVQCRNIVKRGYEGCTACCHFVGETIASLLEEQENSKGQ